MEVRWLFKWVGETVGENMRLIDADELKKCLPPDYVEMDGHCVKNGILNLVDDAPTVDLWHYPSKGELPEKDGEYFITVRLEGGGFLNALALYYVDRGWLGMFNKPYAWQYITLPKEEASTSSIIDWMHDDITWCRRTGCPNKDCFRNQANRRLKKGLISIADMYVEGKCPEDAEITNEGT